MSEEKKQEVSQTFFAEFKQDAEKFAGGKYLTKKELKYRVGDKDLEQTWEILKIARSLSASVLPYEPLKISYVLTPEIYESLHLCDQDLANVLRLTEKSASAASDYVAEILSEEAISSSQLEGAVTTVVVAKDILRKKREPRNTDERMIVNNHRAMQFIRGKADVDLTPEFLCEVQRMVTDGTLDEPEHSGVFRTTDDVWVRDKRTNKELYHPPKAAEIPRLISALCDFANADRKEEKPRFIHPLIMGIALHFLIGYIHPFYDGNGRTARALFYWYVLSRGYRLFEYIPISKMIKNSPGKYRDAYLATENDDLDLTYFILYNISCIDKARKALHEHIENLKSQKSTSAQKVAELSDLKNIRQGNILLYMLEYKGEEFGIDEIAKRFGVTYQTARTDLMHLNALGYLWMRKRGKAQYYSVNSEWRENAGL